MNFLLISSRISQFKYAESNQKYYKRSLFFLSHPIQALRQQKLFCNFPVQDNLKLLGWLFLDKKFLFITATGSRQKYLLKPKLFSFKLDVHATFLSHARIIAKKISTIYGKLKQLLSSFLHIKKSVVHDYNKITLNPRPKIIY